MITFEDLEVLGVDSLWRERASGAIDARDGPSIMMMVGSGDRPPLLEALWPHLTDDEKPALLADAISGGDFPSRVWWFLWAALDELLALELKAFDGDAAIAAYEALPEEITVYRGTCQAEIESGLCGVSWTLNPERALWFATKHGRFRNTNSPAVIVTGTIHKHNIAGVLADRDEAEVLLIPECLLDFDARPAA